MILPLYLVPIRGGDDSEATWPATSSVPVCYVARVPWAFPSPINDPQWQERGVQPVNGFTAVLLNSVLEALYGTALETDGQARALLN